MSPFSFNNEPRPTSEGTCIFRRQIQFRKNIARGFVSCWGTLRRYVRLKSKPLDSCNEQHYSQAGGEMHGSRRGRDVVFVSEKGLTKFVFCILKQASPVEFDCFIVERGYALFRGGGLCAAKPARCGQCCRHDNCRLKP